MVVSTHSFRALRTLTATLALVAAGPACQPEFEDRASSVVSLRILAVRSEPAEATPATTVQYEALAGDANGTRHDVPLEWAYCTLPKPVSETNDINVECFGKGPFIKKFPESGQKVAWEIPSFPDNACNQFGPDLPNIPGQPPGRPTDPDSTGGYYQPIRLALSRGTYFDFTVGETRISCNLPGATSEVLVDYAQRYRPNQNPDLSSVVARTGSSEVTLKPEEEGDSGLVVPGGSVVRLTASWPDCREPGCGNTFCEANETMTNCPEDCTTPKGCPGAESYVAFDLASRRLSDRHEAMRVSWYATAGAFADDRTGRSEQEFATTSTENTWTAPAGGKNVTLWVVIRDSRGGINWKGYRITVQ